MKRNIFLVGLSLVLFVLTSCGLEEAAFEEPPVTENDAKELVKEVYNIKLINKFALIKLSDDELKNVPFDESSDVTSLYYIIDGINEDEEELTIYINSDDKKIHYKE